MKEVVLFSVMLFAAMPALAAECDSVRPDLFSRAQQMAQNSRDMVIRDFSEASVATLEDGTHGQSGATTSSNCLEKYKDVKVGAMIGIPSLGDITKQAIEQVSQEACTSIDSVYAQAAESMKRSVVLPSNIGGAQIGLPGASQLGTTSRAVNTISKPAAAVSVEPSGEAIPDFIRGIFQ